MPIGRTIELLLYFIISFETLGRIRIGLDQRKFSVANVKNRENKVYDGEQKIVPIFKAYLIFPNNNI